jgi:integrase
VSNNKARKSSRRRHNVGSVSFKKKTGLYYAVVNKRNDGRRDRVWSRGHKTAEDAEATLRKMLDGKQPTQASKLNVATVIEKYIAHCVDEDRSPTTIQRYRGIAKHNLDTINHETIDALDDEKIEKLHTALRRRKLSPTTVFHVHTLLVAAVRWATRSQTYPFGVKSPRRAKPQVRAMTRADAAKLLAQIRTSERGNAVLFSLATGMRRGEIAGLRKPSVDRQRGILTVCESRYEIVGEKGQKRTKSDRIREVALSSLANEILDWEAGRQERWKDVAGDLWRESGHVFTDECGQALSPYGMSAAFRLIATKAGISGYTLHGLRHTFATWLLSSGTDVTTVSSLLGHSSASTTLNVYSHVIFEKQHDAVRVVDRLLVMPPATDAPPATPVAKPRNPAKHPSFRIASDAAQRAATTRKAS